MGRIRRNPTRETVVCGQCGVEFVALARDQRKYCSCGCSSLARRGVSNPGTGRPPRPVAERFWAKVKKGDGCWTWQAGKTTYGYGKFGSANAHRVAWELTYGLVPDGMCVCHNCDKDYPVGDITYRLCVRPDHLFLGTMAENMADKMAKGRQPSGEGNPNAKLTAAQVAEIRRMYAAGGVLHRELAAQFGVSRSLVGNIIRGEHWLPIDSQGSKGD